MKTYSVTGIQPPGRVNMRLGGRFQEFNLCDLTQEQLAELHSSGCQYVKETDAPETKSTVSPPRKVEIKKKEPEKNKKK